MPNGNEDFERDVRKVVHKMQDEGEVPKGSGKSTGYFDGSSEPRHVGSNFPNNRDENLDGIEV